MCGGRGLGLFWGTGRLFQSTKQKPLSCTLTVPEEIMTNHAVSLRVTPCLRLECKFWLGDDGWNGSSEHPAITVHASSFEQAKTDMELALGKHMESLLESSRPVTRGQAA
jgi:hypothetical protein